MSGYPPLDIMLFLIVWLTHAALAPAKVTPAAYFYNNERPLIIGHRGCLGYFPEHTLEGYEAAAYMGADFLEPDIVPSKDGHVIVNHRNDLSPCTNVASIKKFKHLETTKHILTPYTNVTQTDWFVEDFTLEQIKELRATQRFPFRDQLLNGFFQKITLEEAIDFTIGENQKRIAKGNFKLLGLYIEPKLPYYFHNIGFNLEEMLLSILEKYNINTIAKASAICPIIIQCFDLLTLKNLSEKTDLPLVLLLEKPWEYDLKLIAGMVNGVGPNFDYVYNKDFTLTEFLETAHENDLAVHPWVIRDDDMVFPVTPYRMYMSSYDNKIDGFFTEFPDSANRYYATVNSKQRGY